MLVDQAADAFFNEYPLIKRNKPTAKKFSMICVSGQHSSIRKAEKTDDVIIVSVQSGFRSLEYIEPVLARKVIVVIDEAHHAVARSYQRIVDFIRRKRRNMKLLGADCYSDSQYRPKQQALEWICSMRISSTVFP